MILNVAVGGNWPGAPDASTQFPQTMLVDYVRVYGTGPVQIAPEKDALIQVYPNPSNGDFSLVLPNHSQDDVEVELLDGQGRLLSSKTMTGNQMKIDMQHRASGLYFLRIKNSTGTQVRKLVKID